jgi:hypothetical protein
MLRCGGGDRDRPETVRRASGACDDDIVLARLGDVTVAVCSPVALVRETVAEFYPSTAAADVPQWTVTAL